MLAVKTPVFEGSLDLLLHLIESEDLDITAVSLIQVTDQYLAALRAADQIDLRPPAEWLPSGIEKVTMKKLLAALAKALERLPSSPAPHRMERAVINVAERRE